MKTFEIRVTQSLSGWYSGILTIEAINKKEALIKIQNMSKRDVDCNSEWKHGDEYEGDSESIEIIEESLIEV